MTNYVTNPQETTSLVDTNIPNTTGINNFFADEGVLDKAANLETTKNNKLKALSKTNPYDSFSKGYTELGDGSIQSNKNKFYNELTPHEIQSVGAYIKSDLSVERDEKGIPLTKEGTPYHGNLKWFYNFGTKASDEAVKAGVARGDLGSPVGRFIDNYLQGYGWAPGSHGVDINKLDKENTFLAPKDVATIYEGLLLGRKEAFDSRLSVDGSLNPEDKQLYGSGVSEYYKNREGLYGAPTEVDLVLGKRLFEEYKEKYNHIMLGKGRSEGRVSPGFEVDQTSNNTLVGRTLNTLSGFGATFLSELIIDPADAMLEMTNLGDLGTEEEKSAMVNNLTGYDTDHVQKSMEHIGKSWDTIVDDNASTKDKLYAAVGAITEAFLTPELLGTSLGAIAAWMSPGVILKGAGIGADLGHTLRAVDAAVDAGTLTRAAARAEKIKAITSVQGAKAAITNQSGYIVAAMGNVNNQYDEFVEHNDGVELEGSDKAKWMAGRFAVQMLNQNIDKIVDVNILTNPALMPSLSTAVKHMTNKEFTNVVNTLAKGLIVTATHAGSEAAQEYAQESMELLNARYGAEAFSDLDTVKEFLLSDEHIREAGIAALAGAGGAGQFEVAGALGRRATDLPLSWNKGEIAAPTKISEVNNSVGTTEDITIADLDEAKSRYGDLLKDTTHRVMKGVDSSNVSSILDAVDELNSTKHVIETSSPESIKLGEELYDTILDSLEEYVKNNTNTKLTTKVVRKSLEQAVKGNKEKEFESRVPEDIRSSFQNLASVMTDGTLTPYRNSVATVISTFKSPSYEATAIEGDTTEELTALEFALTGKVSEDIHSTYDVLKHTLHNKTAKSFAIEPNIDEQKDVILGSKPDDSNNDDEYEEIEYSEYSRALDVERIIGILLQSRTYNSSMIDNMEALARTNGISKKRFSSIVKSYASVEDESIRGPRSYKAYATRLRGLLESSNRKDKAIIAEYNNLARMESSVSSSTIHLKRGVLAAQLKVKELNKQKLTSKNTYTVNTEYEKSNGKYYDITVSKKDGKWVAHTKDAEKLIKTKEALLKDIRHELKDLNVIIGSSVKGLDVSTGTLEIPVREGLFKEAREKDKAYISNVINTLKKINPDTVGVTKVILGDETHPKWDRKGDYYKANSTIVNDEKYSAEDVVLLDSTRTFKDPKGTVDIADFGADAKKAMKKATKAGATFILDRDLVRGTKAIKHPEMYKAIALYFNNKGYTHIQWYDKQVFIKSTPENKKAVRKYVEKAKKDREIQKVNKDNKGKLVSLYRSLGNNVNIEDGTDLDAEKRAEVEVAYEELYDLVLKNSFKGNTENLDKYLPRQSADDLKEAIDNKLKEEIPTPAEYDDKALQKDVVDGLELRNRNSLIGTALMNGWQSILDTDPTRKEREKEVAKILKTAAIAPKGVLLDFLSHSIGRGKEDLYENVYTRLKDGVTEIKVARNKPSAATIQSYKDKNNSKYKHRIGSKSHIYMETRRVVQDFTKLVNIDKTTILNSMGVDYLPHNMKTEISKFSNKAEEILAPVSEPEAHTTTNIRKNGKYEPESLYLHNSPARGLFFSKTGAVNKEVLAAIYVALGDIMIRDRIKLSKGYKSDTDIAEMFNVLEHEVTPEMRSFAYKHGAFLKTVAATVGKSILKQLGMSARKDSTTAAHEYDALVSDIGNTALLVAEKAGLVRTKPAPSNDLAALYRGGERRPDNSQVHFINIADVEVVSGGFTRNPATERVEDFLAQYKTVMKDFPESSTERKEVHTKPPTAERIEEAVEKTRNDITGKKPPESAKETLRTQMSTKYTVDMERLDALIDAVDREDSSILKQLGYVEIDENNPSEEFNNMFYNDKEVQEGKNRDILKSIEELRIFRQRMIDLEIKDPELYFDYFYATNDRYMLDSNTINPQTDKIHRFLFVPATHNLTYKIGTTSNGGISFHVKGVSAKDADQNFTVRMALTQAFGGDVDKMNVEDIIAFGDTILNLTPEQINDVENHIITKGSVEVTTSSGVTLELSAPHISHTLQAIDFVRKVKEAGKGGEMTSALSLEFDSLTSGFANKIQQMPVLSGDMHEQFARTGIITVEYQEKLKNAINFKGDGVEFNPTKGHTVADVIAMGSGTKEGDMSFFDSYKNLAKTVLGLLNDSTTYQGNLTKPVKSSTIGPSGTILFEMLKPLLPGGSQLGEGAVTEISSAMRGLFKNPFMIFNYSASINRIVGNLSYDATLDMARQINNTDFSNTDNKELKTRVENLLNYIRPINPHTEKLITTPEELQEVFRTKRMKDIALDIPFSVGSKNKKGKGTKSKNLEEAIRNTVSLTYGTAVEKAFAEEFKPFIAIQDAMNDSFKVAFRLFDNKRIKYLKDLQKNNEHYIITAEDHKKAINDLWEDFPWFRGPLSETVKDGINVATTDVRSPKDIELARKKPQAILAKGQKNKSRTISPIVKYLEEAVSAGSVLPFHAIDGAEISKMINALSDAGVTIIHDAIIPPLSESDNAGFQYQKGMHEVNREYVLVEALQEFEERIRNSVKEDNFDSEYKDLSIKGLKSLDKDITDIKFPEATRIVLNRLRAVTDEVLKAREYWYGPNGKLKGAYYGNLIGTPGAYYKDGMTSPDLSYKKELEPSYTDMTVTVPEYVDDRAKPHKMIPREEVDYSEPSYVHAEVRQRILEEVGNKLETSPKLDSILDAIVHHTEEVEKIIKNYKSRMEKTKDKKLKKELGEMVKLLASTTANDILPIVKDAVDTTTSRAEQFAAIYDAIQKNLKGC